MDSASTVKVGGKKRDPCWKHGRPGPKRGDVFCNHCKKIVKGGINRFKYHLAKIQCRDTTSCTECTEEATRDAIATLEAYDQRKATKKRTAEAMAAPRADLSSMGSHTDVGTSGSSLGPRIRAKGTLDSNMEKFFIPRNTPGAQPGLLGTAWNKEAHQQAKVACARFFIYNDVPFNAISSPSWDQLVTALTVAGKGFKSPSRYESILATLPNLKRMFVSERWLGSPYATKPEAEKVVIAIFDTNFAKMVEEIINVLEPLVRVLRMVDGDHNSMGYLYEAMDKAKEAIQHLYGSNKTKYEPIWRIIDRRWNHQLHQHIHAAAYFLNPKFFYSPSFKADAEVRIGLDTCIRRLVDDEILRDLILDELQSYKKALGELFSSPDCKRRRATLRPDLWWEDYGATTPNLQKLAIRILSQPCSASGCERNWSVFENIHTKKRNRLTQQRLNDLVYVRYNIRLHEKKVLGQDSHEALDLDDIDPYAAEWVASPDDVDNDLDPFLTNEQLSELERAGEEWDAEVAAREEEQEVDHAEEAPVSVEDVATTSAPPTQWPQSILSFSRRRNL
ncbi:hypothetical protein SUGI_0244610 [Cryptomeria japonica]|nr:hypothetical protein SUGI_0244610 [Cryptomeria japonica]